jgi:hypothetical protein
MIAFNNEQNQTTWQSSFVSMLPEIEQKLRLAFVVWIPRHARMRLKKASCIHSSARCATALSKARYRL